MNNNYFEEIKNRVIEKIKQIIPKDSLDNFENNLQSLNLVFDEPKTQDEFLDNSDMDKGFNPHYDSINNSIVFCSQYLKLLYQESLHTDNPREYYYSNIQENLFHEFVHVASTKIGNDYLSGFDTHNKDGLIGNNIGLTEGYVDYIVRKNINNKYKLPFTGYKELINIVAQLELLIGEDILKEIFFNNKGINSLKEELEKYNIDKTSSEALFLRIQDYYENNYKEGTKNNLIGNINHNLNLILVSKINKMNDEKVSNEEITKLLDDYEKNFISKDILKAYGRDINNYELIEESFNEFNQIKEKQTIKKGEKMKQMNFKGINVEYEEIDANQELGFNFPFVILFPENIKENPELIYACNLPDNYSKDASTFEELQELTKKDYGSIDPLMKHISLESGNILMIPFVPRFNKFRPNFLGRDCYFNDFDKLKDSKFYGSINKYINLADQHKAMINEAIKVIRSKGYMIDDKAIICGYSEGAKFASHLALLHPEVIKAVVAGGTGGAISMPIKNIDNYVFNYPTGIADVKDFDFDSFKDISFYYYMGYKDKCDSAMPKFEPHKIINEKGEEDFLKDECNNLTVFIDENGKQQFLLDDDGNYMAANSLFSDSEVNTINKALGTVIQDRFKKQEEIYNDLNLNSIFKLYKDVNHRTIFDKGKREELFKDVDEFLQNNLKLNNEMRKY